MTHIYACSEVLVAPIYILIGNGTENNQLFNYSKLKNLFLNS